MIEEKIEPSKAPIKLSEQERRVFEVAYNTTSTATNIAAGLVDMAVSTAVSKINELVYDDQQMQTREPVQNASRHFGISALQAVVKIVGGVASAASMVLVSSRDSIIQMIHKKYGTDAGYMAEKSIGSGINAAEMLVYFDARGISRRVVVGGVNEYGKQQKASQVVSTTASTSSYSVVNDGNELVFENEWLDDTDIIVNDNAAPVSKGESSGSNQTKNTDNTLVTV